MIFLMLLVRVEQKRHTEKSMRSADSKTRNVFLVPLKPEETEVVDSTSDLMNDDIPSYHHIYKYKTIIVYIE